MKFYKYCNSFGILKKQKILFYRPDLIIKKFKKYLRKKRNNIEEILFKPFKDKKLNIRTHPGWLASIELKSKKNKKKTHQSSTSSTAQKKNKNSRVIIEKVKSGRDQYKYYYKRIKQRERIIADKIHRNTSIFMIESGNDCNS